MMKKLNYPTTFTGVISDPPGTGGQGVDDPENEGATSSKGPIDLATTDDIATYNESASGVIMRIDREGFKKAVEEDVVGNEALNNLWQNGEIQEAEDYAKKNIFNKPKYFLEPR